MRIRRREYRRNLAAGEKWQKSYVRNACRFRRQGVSLRSLTNEHKSHILTSQFARGVQQSRPRTVEAHVSRMQQHEIKPTANRAHYLDLRRIDPLGQDAILHVFASNNHAPGASQRPTVHPLPSEGKQARLDY